MGIFSRFSDYFLRINSQEQNCWFEGYAHLASWWWLFVSFYIPISSREESLFPHIFASTDFKSLPVQSLTFFLKKKKGKFISWSFSFFICSRSQYHLHFSKGKDRDKFKNSFLFSGNNYSMYFAPGTELLQMRWWSHRTTENPEVGLALWMENWNT